MSRTEELIASLTASEEKRRKRDPRTIDELVKDAEEYAGSRIADLKFLGLEDYDIAIVHRMLGTAWLAGHNACKGERTR